MPWSPFTRALRSTIVVIDITDECTAEYILGGNYDGDKAYWEAMIDNAANLLFGHIRAGILVPDHDISGRTGLDNIVPSGKTLPKDSFNTPFSSVVTPDRHLDVSGRVLAAEIVSFFDTVRAGTEPKYLQFVLDDSGSITVSQYATDLAAAKTQIQAAHPSLTIRADSVTGFPEQPWQFMRDAIADLTGV